MTTNFKVTQIGGYLADLDDILMRREFLSGGNLWMWGNNASGYLGDGTTVNKSSPVTTAGSGVNWRQITNNTATYGIKQDGTLWAWGSGGNGALGDGTTVNKSSPVTISGGGTNWIGISANSAGGAAIKSDGTLWTWGFNGGGNLADGTTANKSSPVTTIGGQGTWASLMTGASGSQTVAAIKLDGSLWIWSAGSTNSGILVGDGTGVAKSSPVTTAGGGNNWKSVTCGYGAAAAVKTDGTLWTWGLNTSGQLGTGVTTSTNSPVTTAGGGVNWKMVAQASSGFGAVKTDGTLWTWGLNTTGGLGDGTTVNKSSPVTVAGGGTTWKVACGYGAIKTDGTLWTWGSNGGGSGGRVGDGTTANKSSPVQVAGAGTVWKIGTSYNVGSAITDLTF